MAACTEDVLYAFCILIVLFISHAHAFIRLFWCRYLKNLLFCHGAEALRRNSFQIYQTIWKNVVFGLADFFYAFVSAWSAADLFNSWLKQLFNVLYTTLPVVLYSIFDRQLPMEVTLQTPVLYPAFASEAALSIHRSSRCRKTKIKTERHSISGSVADVIRGQQRRIICTSVLVHAAAKKHCFWVIQIFVRRISVCLVPLFASVCRTGGSALCRGGAVLALVRVRAVYGMLLRFYSSLRPRMGPWKFA